MAPSEMDSELKPGLLLGGKYRLEREIGRGAMGTVWSAVHESLEQLVAIKVISQDHAGSEELRKRFATEARAAAKLRSRFVVGVSDNGETKGGLPYIVMEYLEGECLEDRIMRLGSIPLEDAMRITRHITRALSRAHAHGIVHRDLKPANIFICRSEDDADHQDWTAKVLDFGIAKMEDFGERSTTKTGTVLGTPLFMSPEQVRGASSVDGRADLYSLGMVVYNMLTGTFAFEGQSFGDLLVSICTDPLPQLTLSAPHVPEALDAWFEKACARDPGDRFQSAEEFMQGLAEAVGEITPSADRLSAADYSMRMSQPLAATFAVDDTATDGTPESARGSKPAIAPTVVSSSHSDSTGMAASAVTVNHLPERSSKPLLYGAVAVAALVGTLFAFMGGETETTGSHAADSPAEPTPEPRDADAPAKASTDEEVAEETPAKSPNDGDSQTEHTDPAESEETTAAKPATAKPAAAKPAVAKPAIAKPTAAKPTAAKPAVTKPAIAKPAITKPASPAPATKPSVPDLGF